jgi:hypothetical protein
MDKLFGPVPENQKQILKSVLPLLVIIMLFVIVGKYGFSEVQSLRNQIKIAEKTRSVLSDKLTLLNAVSQSTVDQVTATVFALPKSNPTLQTISQLKTLSLQNLVVLEDIKSSNVSEGTSGISYVNTSFKITGTRDQILAFAKSIGDIAPISVIDKMDLAEASGVNTANISVKTFFAEFPKTIPTISQPVTDLTASEKELLSQIVNLVPPMFDESKVLPSTSTNPYPFGE